MRFAADQLMDSTSAMLGLETVLAAGVLAGAAVLAWAARRRRGMQLVPVKIRRQ